MRLSGLKTSKKSPEEIPKKDELEDQTLEEPNFNDEKDDQFDSPPIDFPRKPSIPTLYDSAKDFAESFFKDDSNSIYDEFPTHMDTRETQYHYIVNLVVPGVAVEDIKVEGKGY